MTGLKQFVGWKLLALAAAAWFFPVLASAAVSAPVPQGENLLEAARRQITRNFFSTDVKGWVEGIWDVTPILGPAPTCVPSAIPAEMQVFIVNPDQCVGRGEHTAYRIVLRNIGDEEAYNVEVDFIPPPDAGIVNTDLPDMPIPSVPPGHNVGDFSATVRFGNTKLPATAWAKVKYYDCTGSHEAYECRKQGLTQCFDTCENNRQQCSSGNCQQKYGECMDTCKDEWSSDAHCQTARQAVTQHTMKAEVCEVPKVPVEPLRPKRPAIICDPAEKDCDPALPALGKRFVNAVAWMPGLNLGARFKEAIADIIPGECRVVDDNVVATDSGLRYHDALNRQGKSSADFMFPLYESGRDFAKLVQENELLGIPQKLSGREALSQIHSRSWQDLAQAAGDVLNGKSNSNALRQKISPATQSYEQQVSAAQRDLKQRYANMQRERLDKFDPAAGKAIENARKSIKQACTSPQAGDGGLALLLPNVKQVYAALLTAREQAYDTMQEEFLHPANALAQALLPATWQNELRQALSAFDAGDKTALQEWLQRYPPNEQDAFNALWNATYEQHARTDRQLDDDLRLQQWEIALDTPKQVAATCETDKILAAPVETSWCESNEYPEFVLKGAPHPIKEPQIRPPTPIPDGEKTDIDNKKVIGDVCGGEPGDPYWADDCSCHCDEIVPGGGASLKTCGNGSTPITRHDINVTSPSECMLDKPRHEEPFF